jgi:hypothetical protein
MAAHLLNPYVVISAKIDNAETRLFHELAINTDYFRALANLATCDRNGIYECWYQEKGYLFSCSTSEKPVAGHLLYVTALQYGTGTHPDPIQLSIPSQSDDVLWNIRTRS